VSSFRECRGSALAVATTSGGVHSLIVGVRELDGGKLTAAEEVRINK
jgi:hypothetical protein